MKIFSKKPQKTFGDKEKRFYFCTRFEREQVLEERGKSRDSREIRQRMFVLEMVNLGVKKTLKKD